MPYILETVTAGKTKEIRKYYSTRFHPKNATRGKNIQATPEAVKRVNQRIAETTLRRLINNNYQGGDLLLTLDFHQWQPIDSIEMQSIISGALRKLKRLYARAGQSLKYIYVKEIGPRGARHIHMIVNKIDLEILRLWWTYGGLHVNPLDDSGQYRKIAAYFIKYALTTENTEGKLIGKRWYGSQNLIKPKVKKEVIKANTFKNVVREEKGYYLDKDTLAQGVSELTGFEYFGYTLIMNPRGPNESKYLHPHDG